MWSKIPMSRFLKRIQQTPTTTKKRIHKKFNYKSQHLNYKSNNILLPKWNTIFFWYIWNEDSISSLLWLKSHHCFHHVRLIWLNILSNHSEDTNQSSWQKSTISHSVQTFQQFWNCLTPLPLTIPCKKNIITKPRFKATFHCFTDISHAGLYSYTEFFLGWGCIHLFGQAYLIVCEGRSSVQGGMDKRTRQMRNRMQWYMSMDVRIKMKCRMCRFFRIHKLVPSRQASSCKCRDRYSWGFLFANVTFTSIWTLVSL